MLERAARLKPEEPAYAIAGRALMFSEKGDFKSAHTEMARAMPLVHGNEARSQVLAARAVILDRQGRRDEAMNDFDEAIRLDPGHAVAYADRGNIWRLRGDLARALTDLNIAVRLEPHNPTIFAKRGEVLRYRGELAEALNDFNRALTLNPTRCVRRLIAYVTAPCRPARRRPGKFLLRSGDVRARPTI